MTEENQTPYTAAGNDDTEGHIVRGTDDGDDTEGHIVRGTDDGDDTEGHIVRGTDDGDDTEGHIVRGTDDGDDTEVTSCGAPTMAMTPRVTCARADPGYLLPGRGFRVTEPRTQSD